VPGGGSKPGERRGGRKVGTPNKVTKDSRERFRKMAEELEPTILKIALKGSVAAIQEIFNRAYGKPPQPLSGEGGEGDAVVRVITGVDRGEEKE
jgi:hypothetical protein